jgi:hypothetical protein
MGLGKTFEMIGICKLFSDDPEQFAYNIGKSLQCNIELRTNDWLTEEKVEEDELVTYTKKVDLGFNKTEIVIVEYETDDRCKNTNKLNRYCIEIDFKQTNLVYYSLELDFYPFGIVHGHLPSSESTWFFLYEALIGKLDICFNYHIEQVKELYAPRNLYRQILLNLGISEIVMFTENNYHFEAEFWNFVGTKEIESIHEFVSMAKELDKLQVFDYLKTIDDSAKGELCYEFLNSESYKIIFIDSLHDQLTL